jgi:nucleotide-binding universal stress UspA family protein
MNVLLATDGSPQATVALETAAALLRKERAKFDLLCVAPEFTPPKASREKDAKKRSRMIESYRERIRVEAREILVRAQAPLAARGPALEIISEAESGGYDLIVMGATGESDLKHDILGSVSTRVAQDAPCSVFVAKFVE